MGKGEGVQGRATGAPGSNGQSVEINKYGKDETGLE
jgi:hypothetical protein